MLLPTIASGQDLDMPHVKIRPLLSARCKKRTQPPTKPAILLAANCKFANTRRPQPAINRVLRTMFTALADPKNPARIRNVLLGSQPVKIITSIMAATISDLIETALDYQKQPIDILEWRADFFSSPDVNSFIAAALELKQRIEKPVLFTLRTKAEGGLYPENEDYLELVRGAAQSGLVDAVDMELQRGIKAKDVALARAAGTCVIVSYHNFHETPSVKELVDLCLAMDALDADVLKIAVMPQKPEDVLALLEATCLVRRRTQKPVISMSMGSWGALSRISGTLFGSSATFASIDKASAPGQFPIEAARRLMQELF